MASKFGPVVSLPCSATTGMLRFPDCPASFPCLGAQGIRAYPSDATDVSDAYSTRCRLVRRRFPENSLLSANSETGSPSTAPTARLLCFY